MDQDTRTALSLCRDIEEHCARIYFYYAEVFSDQPEIRILWEKTAYEEKNHAGLLKMALNCRDIELTGRTYDLVKYRNQEKIVGTICQNLVGTRPSLEDALRSSINLERKLNEFHLDAMVDFRNKSEEDLFRKLAGADCNHVADLENAYRKLLENRSR